MRCSVLTSSIFSMTCLQEAFVKIREQAKAYLEMKGELTSGLNLINSTNLDYFSIKHKAEIFRLKGDFLLKLSDCEGANLAYSNAITLFKNLPKGWISWGNYCDMVCISLSWFNLLISFFFLISQICNFISLSGLQRLP